MGYLGIMQIIRALALVTLGALLMSPLNSAQAQSPQTSLVKPKPLSVPNPITFSNILSRIDEVPSYAYKNAHLVAKANAKLSSAQKPVVVVKGSHLETKNYDGATSWIKWIMAMYGRFALPAKTYLFAYPEQDVKEIQVKANQLVLGGEDVNGRAAALYETGSFGAGSNCQRNTPMRANTTERTAISNIFGGICVGSDPLDARTGVAHEFAHAVQVMQFHRKGPTSKWRRADVYMYNTLPCWPVEGQAVFTGFSNLDTLDDYKSVRMSGRVHPYLLTGAGGSAGLPNTYWTAQDVMNYYTKTSVPGSCQTDPSFALGYSLGFLTVEALTAMAGPESHMAVVQRIAEGKSLNTAFKEIYGLTWTAAAPVLSQVVAKGIMNILDPPTPLQYVAKSTTESRTFIGKQGCAAYNPASPYISFARLQAFVDNQWQDVKSISSSWNQSNDCFFIPGGGYLASVEAKIDPGTPYRWIYLGPVNIGSRDEYGRGLSSSATS